MWVYVVEMFDAPGDARGHLVICDTMREVDKTVRHCHEKGYRAEWWRM